MGDHGELRGEYFRREADVLVRAAGILKYVHASMIQIRYPMTDVIILFDSGSCQISRVFEASMEKFCRVRDGMFIFSTVSATLTGSRDGMTY